MRYGKTSATVNAFAEKRFHEFCDEYSNQLKHEIESESKDYILKIDETEYTQHLTEKYTLEQLEVDTTNPDIREPRKIFQDRTNHYGESYKIEGYSISSVYKFKGSPILFKMAPNSRMITSYPITIVGETNSLILSVDIYNQDANTFTGSRDAGLRQALINMPNLNGEVAQWNQRLPKLVENYFKNTKDKYLKENKFFEQINVNVNKNTESIYSVPMIKRKIIPQPVVSDKKVFTSVPSFSDSVHKDILKIIFSVGKSMERKPSTYKDKSEEDLRDNILMFLETRYDGTTATGETFNKSGKTDILLKYEDGTNLFVAECKYWGGAVVMNDAIDQLFDRYLTWCDSKAAVILFVQRVDFSSVLATIKEEAKKHQYFLKEISTKDESSFSYEFHLPGDKGKIIQLEIMAFHFKK
jgi:hypothetical protein